MPFSFNQARNARSTCTENGTPSRSFTRRRPSITAGSTRKAVSSFGRIDRIVETCFYNVKDSSGDRRAAADGS